MLQAQSKFFTPDEYLQHEEKSEGKHEYFQGEIFDECDFYRELLDGEQIAFLLSRNQIEEVKDLIFVELKSIIDDIKYEEELARHDEEEIM